MKTRVLVKEGEYRLTKSGVMDAKIDAEELYCYMNRCDKVMLFLRKDEEVDKETEERYFRFIETRAARVPLQHITGVQEFMGFEFKVGSEVLIPRQDTEILVTEAAQVIRREQKELQESKAKGSIFKKMRGIPEYRVLDLCCGSGAIGISLAKICENIEVTAADISRKALELASVNASALRVDIDFLEGDMFEALRKGLRFDASQKKAKRSTVKAHSFDMIVSNPPYIKTKIIPILQEEVKKYEPLEALDGGADGLDFYRTIVSEAAEWLKPSGHLIMEIGYDQGEDLRKLIRDDGRYGAAEVIRDLAGKERVVKCRRAV